MEEIHKLKDYIDKRLDKIEEKGDSGLKLINTKIETLQSNTKKIETEALPSSNPCRISALSPNVQPVHGLVEPPNSYKHNHNIHKRKKHKSVFLSKPKVLYIGDSIAHNVDFNTLEKTTNTRIKTAKAYGAVFDNNAKYPQMNMTDVAEEALDKIKNEDEFTELVLSAPTIDITNLDTSHIKPDDNTEALKQSVTVSCHNIFTAAEKALNTHPNLEKVLILEHPPRFDQPDIDPLGLKPQLARYANLVYNQLWLASSHKQRIKIGTHKLDCSENEFNDRYKDVKTNRFDGLHMYGKDGRSSYTRNLISIFRNVSK